MSISSLEFNSNREYRTSEDNNSPRNQQNVTDLAQQTLTNITSTHNLPSNYVPFSPIHPQPTLDNGYQSSINLEKTYLYKRYNKIHPVINDVDDEILQTVIKHTPSKFHNNKHFLKKTLSFLVLAHLPGKEGIASAKYKNERILKEFFKIFTYKNAKIPLETKNDFIQLRNATFKLEHYRGFLQASYITTFNQIKVPFPDLEDEDLRMIKGNLLKVGFDESFINENTFDTCILAIFGKGFGYYLPTALQETKGVRYPISSEYFENFLVRLYESNNGENLLKFIGVIDTFINQRSPELSIFWNYCLI